MAFEEVFHAGNQPRLVGRAEEKRQLGRALAAARHGRGAVVLVTGEAGIGKTRLLLEALATKRAQEMVVLRGHASPGPHQAPFGHIADSLRSARLNADDRIWTALESRSDWLSAVLPELEIVGTQRVPADIQLVFQTILDALKEGAGNALTAWLLDDMQWADAASWSFLRYASQRIATSRLILLAACRDDELGGTQPARSEIVATMQQPGLRRVHLDRLSSPETERLVGAVGGTKLAAAVVARLSERSAGNPRAATDLAEAALTNEGAAVPASISLEVDRRAGSLTADARELLEVLAVIGVEGELELLLTLRPAADAALAQLTEAGLVSVGGAASRPQVRFRHPLFCEAVYERAAWTRRRLLHAELADALERLKGRDDPDAMADAAGHRELSGDPEGALRSLTTAAEAASSAGDARQAGDLYLAALSAASRDRRLAHHSVSLSRAAIQQLAACGRWPELIPLASEAWAARWEATPVEGTELSRVLGTALLMTGRVEEGYSLLVTEADRLVADRGRSHDSGAAGEASALLAATAAAADYLGDADRSQRLTELAASSEQGRTDPLVECLSIAHRFRRDRERQASAQAFHENAVRALRRGRTGDAAVASWNHARMTTQISHAVTAEALGDRAGSLMGSLSRLLLGTIHLLEGRPGEAARALSRAESEVRTTAPLLAPFLDGLQAHLHLHQRDLARARRLLKPWGHERSELRSASLALVLGAKGWLAWENRDFEEAADQLQRCSRVCATTGYGLLESGPLLLPLQIDALLRLGRLLEAEQAIEDAAARAGFDRFFIASLAAAYFRLRPSAASAKAAQRGAASAPWPFLDALVMAWRAQLLGDVEAGEAARARFAAVERKAVPERSEEVPSFTYVEPVAINRASPLRMSKRELQIADLVAEGLTNKAIADRLVLSPETVATHVKHILGKLNFKSRSQVATWLTEHRARSHETDALLRFAGTKIPRMGDSPST